MSVQQVLDGILGQAGVVFILLLILWSGYKGWWTWGWYAREQRERIARLEGQLDRATRIAQSGTGLARRATDLAEERRTEVAGE